MAQQTALEWLVEQLSCVGIDVGYGLLEQAKQMEKEQAFELFKAGQDSMEEEGKNFEQYYGKYNGNKLGKE